MWQKALNDRCHQVQESALSWEGCIEVCVDTWDQWGGGKTAGGGEQGMVRAQSWQTLAKAPAPRLAEKEAPTCTTVGRC